MLVPSPNISFLPATHIFTLLASLMCIYGFVLHFVDTTRRPRQRHCHMPSAAVTFTSALLSSSFLMARIQEQWEQSNKACLLLRPF